MAARTLEDWIDSLQAAGRYTFQREEAIEQSGLSGDAVKKALQRMARRGRIAKVKHYFYVIVPLEYKISGAPPASWFIDELMKTMDRPYYVGLLSAASQHGASHQQPQQFQIITDRPVRPVSAGRLQISFFVSKFMPDAACDSVKTATGSMRISTPETTAVDLVRFARSVGYLHHVATVLGELAPRCDPKKLLTAAKQVEDLPNAQRLGYILDHVQRKRITDPLQLWLARQNPGMIPLWSGRPAEDVRTSRRWRLLLNGSIEIDE